jgi:hypothetical protein
MRQQTRAIPGLMGDVNGRNGAVHGLILAMNWRFVAMNWPMSSIQMANLSMMVSKPVYVI